MAVSDLANQWMANPTLFDPTQQSNQFSLFNNAALPFPPTYNGAPTNAMGQPIQSFQQWQQQNPGGVSLNATPAQPDNSGQFAFNKALINSMGQSMLSNGLMGGQANGGGRGDAYTGLANNPTYGNLIHLNALNNAMGQTGAQGAAQPQAGGGAPNNWQAAINALSNPGNPQTMGANVPLQTGYQPAGGVNQAFLQQAQGQPNMNQGFLSALNAIQGRR
jgi:hypothetical protein